MNVAESTMTTQDGRVSSVSSDSTSPQLRNEDEVFEENNNIDKPTINHVYVDCYSIAATNVLVRPRFRLTLMRAMTMMMMMMIMIIITYKNKQCMLLRLPALCEHLPRPEIWTCVTAFDARRLDVSEIAKGSFKSDFLTKLLERLC